MKSSRFVRYDSKSDALYIVAGRGVEEEFVEVAPGVNVELDAKALISPDADGFLNKEFCANAVLTE